MVEIIKIGNKTLVMDGKILSLFRKGLLLRQMYYGGYEDFDNANGGAWKKYINIPITTIPSEYAQYLIEIDDTNVSVYNVEGTLKAQSSIASEFWSLVRSDGFDIRVFDHLFRQLWFWVEEFDYTNKKAKIWVRLPENSEELNIAFGNEKASESSYNNGDETFEFFDDFEGTELDTTKWEAEGSVTVQNSELTVSNTINVKTVNALDLNNKLIIIKYKFTQHDFGFWISDTNDYERGNDYAMIRTTDQWDFIVFDEHGTTYTIMSGAQTDTYYIIKVYTGSNVVQKVEINGNVASPNFDTNLNAYLKLGQDPVSSFSGTATYDYVKVLKLADPASFTTPRIIEF